VKPIIRVQHKLFASSNLLLMVYK